MVTVVDKTPIKKIADEVNKRLINRLLTPTNHFVLSVEPYTNQQRSDVNTVAVVDVDLYINEPYTVIPASDIKSVRKVYYNRIDLFDIVKVQGLPLLPSGVINIEVIDEVDVIKALDANIKVGELNLQYINDKVLVSAPEQSLGFIGSITFINGKLTKPASVSATVSVG